MFASSSEQLGQWKEELGVEKGGVASIPVRHVLPNCVVDGPDEELAGEVRELHVLQHGKAK